MIELLACKSISDQARTELERAGCPIHKDVPGLDNNIEIVELHHEGWESGDRSGMFVWDVPREIQIKSLNLSLFYVWNADQGGYELSLMNEEEEPQKVEQEPEPDELGDLDGPNGRLF